MNPTIIVVGYNRVDSIKRLLDSLNAAIYPLEGVDIILSLDGGYSQAVFEVCTTFMRNFKSGRVEFITRTENIGLRSHVLWCGSQVEKKGAVLVLEDDLYVDPQFYRFASRAATFYENEDDIAGISLYAQEHNEYARLPFKPIDNGFSGYFLQVACSWGQLWTPRQWNNFNKWYELNSERDLLDIDGLPDAVKEWPESSWKKYFSAYLILENKTFFYPYRTYTTNCSDAGGQHIKNETNIFQVSLAYKYREYDEFKFPEYDQRSIKYDGFMEPASDIFFESIGFTQNEVEIDFYGTKPIALIQKKKYVLTTRQVTEAIKKYPLSFKPYENICLSTSNVNGEVSIALSEKVHNKQKSSLHALVVYLAGFDGLTKSYSLIFMRLLVFKIINKFKKIIFL